MDPRDTVVVTGTGRVAAPDTLVVDLQIEGHAPTVAGALEALAAGVSACEAALPDHRPRTRGLALHPRHDERGRQVGHTASQSVQVSTEEPGEVGRLITRAAAAVGAGLTVGGLHPRITDTTELAVRAREAAVDDARARAEHYAQLAGRHLGPVLWVREGGEDGHPLPVREARMMAAGPAVDPADEEVVALVQMAWSLLD